MNPSPETGGASPEPLDSEPLGPGALDPEPLTPEALGHDPIQAFARWLADAENLSAMQYPNAVTLSTVRADGTPDGRIVLLKGVDARGFTFYTNHESAKGRALDEHPAGALTFYWDRMGRQVRVRGRVERVSAEESDAYFASRPRESRIGAWASAQSRPLASREALVARVRELTAQYTGGEVPRPPHWGGYLLRPDEIELWQEGEFRLHDRFLYERADSGWKVVRLSP